MQTTDYLGKVATLFQGRQGADQDRRRAWREGVIDGPDSDGDYKIKFDETENEADI